MKIDMSAEDAAKMLRGAAELTASNSRNWANYEAICQGVINDALMAGRQWAEHESITTLKNILTISSYEEHASPAHKKIADIAREAIARAQSIEK
jgi:hypothetical protein